LNIGTGGQVSWAVSSFRRVPGTETRYLPHRRYMLVGASLCGGRSYAWLNAAVQAWLGEFGRPADRTAVYVRLNALAGGAPADCDGLVVDTRFDGTRVDPAVRGAMQGISLDNFTLANLSRAVLTGIVDELLGFLAPLGKAASEAFEVVVASGNAIRKNPVLREIVRARACTAIGIWPDLGEAARCIQYLPKEGPLHLE